MKCVSCGKEIPAGSKYCAYCGTKQPCRCIKCGHVIPEEDHFCPYCGQDQTVKADGQSAKTTGRIDSAIDNIGDDIGGGIDDAVDDLKNAFHGNRKKNEDESFSDRIDEQGEGLGQQIDEAAEEVGSDIRGGAEKIRETASDFNENKGKYLSDENLEILISVSPMLPLFFAVVTGVMNGLGNALFYSSPGGIFGTAAGVIFRIMLFVFFACAAEAVIAAVYLLVKRPEKRTTWGYIAAASTVIGFLGCLASMKHWRGFAAVLTMIGIFWGLDLFSRVTLQKLGVESEPAFGTDFACYADAVRSNKAEREAQEAEEQRMIDEDPNASCFDGTGGQLFGSYLLLVLVSLLTCGIGTPWLLCRIYRWRKSHTVINGRRLAFNGTGGSLFGHWIIWDILTIVTCGIFGLFEYVALTKWEIKHTTYEDDPGTTGIFDGSTFQYWGYSLLAALLNLVTIGIAWPWSHNMIQRWFTRHVTIGRDRFCYDGTAGGIFVQYLICWLLCIVTLGIYSPWATCRINRYIYAHTHVNYDLSE